MSTKNDRGPFRGMRAPHAPADLRQRVLQAAANAMRDEEPHTVWDRIWESRALGWSWATVTLGLLVVHAGLSLGPGATDRAGELRSVERRQAREIRRLMKLPEVEISPRAAALALGGRNRPKKTARPDDSNPSSRS